METRPEAIRGHPTRSETLTHQRVSRELLKVRAHHELLEHVQVLWLPEPGFGDNVLLLRIEGRQLHTCVQSLSHAAENTPGHEVITIRAWARR